MANFKLREQAGIRKNTKEPAFSQSLGLGQGFSQLKDR